MSGWPQCSGRARRGGLCSAADGSAVTASQCGTSPGATSATVTGSALHGDREPGSALRVPNRAHGPGECRASLPWGPKSGQAGAGHGPLDNCSSQPFLISGEISRVPAQRDAHRDKVLRKQLTMPLRWQGQGRAAAGVTLALALPPLSLSPVLHLPCSALSTADDTDSPPSPPSLAAVGCAVGPWGPWSGCSSRCGAGSRARSRQVTVPPRHGGDPCPDLKQRRGCLGQHPTCGTAKAALLPEVAKIVPRAFSQDFRDPWRRAGLPLPEPSGSCGYFRLAQVGAPCRGHAWSRGLRRGQRVCVQCWGNPSRRRPHCTGHGLPGARTFWVAASVVGCQGSWVQEGLQEGCVCSQPALIFV
ncbi:uncharacterized protein LOC134560337 isoform X2 [Prinia subflava]|uniref:uncharacterized protein LOC134560337 isoform X2 n=1 Tax=Prinia subflava TaxID=208062 RepID=UPI002FE2662B